MKGGRVRRPAGGNGPLNQAGQSGGFRGSKMVMRGGNGFAGDRASAMTDGPNDRYIMRGAPGSRRSRGSYNYSGYYYRPPGRDGRYYVDRRVGRGRVNLTVQDRRPVPRVASRPPKMAQQKGVGAGASANAGNGGAVAGRRRRGRPGTAGGAASAGAAANGVASPKSQPRRRRNGGANGGRNRGRDNSKSSGGAGSRGKGSRTVSESELNAQLDRYMGDDSVKTRLDNELDQYFNRAPSAASEPAAAVPIVDDKN